jgi:hypothetical protein
MDPLLKSEQQFAELHGSDSSALAVRADGALRLPLLQKVLRGEAY